MQQNSEFGVLWELEGISLGVTWKSGASHDYFISFLVLPGSTKNWVD